MEAPDAKVLAVAIQANALAFIMQNDEDYTASKVISRVTDHFNQITSVAKYGYYPNLMSLLDMAHKGEIDFKHLMFVNMTLPFLKSAGLKFVEDNFTDFIVTLKNSTVKQDCTWQMVLKALDFMPEQRKIEQYLLDNKQNVSEEQRRDITQAM